MIAYVIAILIGVAVGIVVGKVADWILPEEVDENEEND
jgi:hypothetical protein